MAPRLTLRANRAAHPAPTDLNRIGGHPIGIGLDNWPRIFNPATQTDQPMIHVLTVDARAVGAAVPDSVLALALFVSSADEPFYFDDPTSDYAVVPLRQPDIAAGELPAPDLPEHPLPAAVLELKPGRGSGRSYAGGRPRWIQSHLHDGEDTPDDFVLQFDTSLVRINLGDSGVCYMFTGWAMWECL